MLTACSFHRELQGRPQAPILELPAIPRWVDNTNPVLQTPPTPLWGEYNPTQMGTVTNSVAAVVPSYPSPVAVPSQQWRQGPPSTTSLIGPSEQLASPLVAFGCEWDPTLGYILCKRHEILLPASRLRNHLFEEHRDNFPVHVDRRAMLKDLLLSLEHVHGLEPSQGYPGPEWELLYPIHKRVYAGRRCSLCAIFFHTNQRRNYAKHFNKYHGGAEKIDWSKLQFFSTLHQPFESGQLYLIPSQNNPPPISGTAVNAAEPETYEAEPESLRLPLKAPPDPPPPQFCQELGFVSWVESLGQQQDVLNYLIATPGTMIVKNMSGKNAGLENTLLRVHTFLDGYLSSGRSWLFVHHGELHDILGKRCQSGYISLLSASD
jgi:hypothetical protein